MDGDHYLLSVQFLLYFIYSSFCPFFLSFLFFSFLFFSLFFLFFSSCLLMVIHSVILYKPFTQFFFFLSPPHFFYMLLNIDTGSEGGG